MSDNTPGLIAALKKSIEDFVAKMTEKLKGYASKQELTEGLNARPTTTAMTQAINSAVSNRPTTTAMAQAISDAVSDRPTTSAMNQAIGNAVNDRPSNTSMNQAIADSVSNRPTSAQVKSFTVSSAAPTTAEINALPEGAVWFQTGT